MHWTLMTVGLMAALLGSCGSDGGDGATSATTTSATQTPPSQPPSTGAQGVPGDFRTSTFVPGFSAHLPAGWTVEERDVGLAQLWQKCPSCEHGGEENGEITIGRDLSALPPAEAAAHVVAAQTGTAGPIEPANIASHAGTHVSITRPGTAELRFTESGYHTEATGDPVDVYFIDVGGQTVSILVDSHIAAGTAATAFHQTVAEFFQSLQFES
jgi:hypothetical protein